MFPEPKFVCWDDAGNHSC